MDSQKPPEKLYTILNPNEVEVFKRDIRNFLFDVGAKLSGKGLVKSLTVDSDRSDQVNLYCDLKNGKFLRLKVFVQHMLETKETDRSKIWISGSIKDTENSDWTHITSIHQFYDWDKNIVADLVEEELNKLK